jgi:hypothetical protein
MEMELLQISGLDRRRVLRVTARWCGPTTTERNDVLPSHCIGKYRTYILCGEEDSSCEVRSIIGTETDHGRGECMQMVRRQQPKKKNVQISRSQIKGREGEERWLLCARVLFVFLLFPSSKTEDEEAKLPCITNFCCPSSHPPVPISASKNIIACSGCLCILEIQLKFS